MLNKKAVILLAAALSLTALAACSKAGATQTTASEPTSISGETTAAPTSSSGENATAAPTSSSGENAISPTSGQTTRQQDGHYPLTLSIYDDKGNPMEQTIEKEPQRIVVIGQGYVEWMLGLGAKDHIVGIAYLDKSFSKYEDEIKTLPVITDMWPSKESVLALHPDLIISMSSAFHDDRLGDISFWNERGIPVLAGINYTIGRTIDSFFEDIDNLGKALNIEDKTDAFITDQKSRISEIQAKAAQAGKKPTVLLLGTSGDITYYYGPSLALADEMIDGSGGEFVKVSPESYVEMSDESILSVNPDMIIVTGFQKSDQEALRNKFLLNPKLKNAAAVKSGSVKVLEYTTAVRGGLDLADMYMDVAEFIHPELFKGE